MLRVVIKEESLLVTSNGNCGEAVWLAMANSSFHFSISSNGSFVVPATDGENITLKYVSLAVKVVSTAVILTSSVLIFVTMALTSKLRTAVDIVFSQVIISSVVMTAVNSVYQSYLSWTAGSRQSMVFCLFMSSLGMANYTVALTSYLWVAIMQLLIVKKGISTFCKVFTREKACMASVGMWIVSIAAGGALVAGRHGNESAYIYNTVVFACHSHVLGSKLFNLPLALCITILTFVSITATFICYAIIMRALKFQAGPSHEPISRTPKATSAMEKLSSKTCRRLVTSMRRIFALMSIYLLVLLPSGVTTASSAVLQTSQLTVYKQAAFMLSTLGIAAYFPVYIISHRRRRRACYLLVTGRYKDIAYAM